MARYFSYHNDKFPQIDFSAEYLGEGDGALTGWTHYRKENGEEGYMKMQPDELTWYDHIPTAEELPDTHTEAPQSHKSEQPLNPTPAQIEADMQAENGGNDDSGNDDDVEAISDLISQLQQVGKPEGATGTQARPRRKRRTKAEMAAAREEAERQRVIREQEAAAQQQQEEERQRKQQRQARQLNIFATVLAVLIVAGIVVFGAGALAAFAFLGAGGMLAKT